MIHQALGHEGQAIERERRKMLGHVPELEAQLLLEEEKNVKDHCWFLKIIWFHIFPSSY